jgi:GTP:adenosylcobinamide-phosphate guanylyltransferase
LNEEIFLLRIITIKIQIISAKEITKILIYMSCAHFLIAKVCLEVNLDIVRRRGKGYSIAFTIDVSFRFTGQINYQ